MRPNEKTLLGYYGGKQALAPLLVPMIPPHRIWLEPFGGMASMTCTKPRSEVEIYNDLDCNVVNLLQTVRDHHAELQLALQLTPYSRTEYKRALKSLKQHNRKQVNLDQLEWARVTYLIIAQSWANGLNDKGWGHGGPRHDGNLAQCWLNRLERIPDIARRLTRVVLENRDGISLIAGYNHAAVMVYADPPYMLKTRTAKGYLHEMTADQHQQLITTLIAHKGPAMISGYQCEEYQQLELAGWERKDFSTVAHAGAARGGKRTSARVESVWLNPRCAAWNQQRQMALPFIQPTLSTNINRPQVVAAV